MGNKLFIWLLSFWVSAAFAQVGDEAFTFLRLPASARANALGGHTVSLVETDPSLIFHNPALLGAEMDKMVNLNYLNYISDINAGSAVFAKAAGDSAAWAVGASFMGYGDIREVTSENVVLGNVSAKDIALQGFYSRDLNPHWRGALSMKFLYSSWADYTSIGLCFDAGLSYYQADQGFSAGIVLKNVGAQLKAYNDERQKMPWDIQGGISKRMNHAPIRFSLTAQYLNRWKFDADDRTALEGEGDNFTKRLFKHLLVGVDFLPSDHFWLGVGFNPKAHYDLKLRGSNGLAGFTAGAGLKLKMFDVGVSMAKYHPSALSLMLSLSLSLQDFRL